MQLKLIAQHFQQRGVISDDQNSFAGGHDYPLKGSLMALRYKGVILKSNKLV
jgi:hypothetical protein